MPGPPVHAFICRENGPPAYRIERTRRSLTAAGVSTATEIDDRDLASLFRRTNPSPTLLIQAGAWFLRTDSYQLPPPSATNKGICAFGLSVPGQNQSPSWLELLAATGGSLRGRETAVRSLGIPPVCYLDREALRSLEASNRSVASGHGLLNNLLELSSTLRFVHWTPFDVRAESALRVLQIITSLQRGGAERMVLHLSSELAKRPVVVRLAATGHGSRASFPTPPAWLDLNRWRMHAENPMETLMRVAAPFDVLHLHLLSGQETARLTTLGIPVVITVHNTQPGWPPGLLESAQDPRVLLAACSLDVEKALLDSSTGILVRSAWNGIDLTEFKPSLSHTRSRDEWRKKWNWGVDDIVLLSVANPRPQKRLDRLPAILAALRSRSQREVRLVFAGEASFKMPESQASATQVAAEVARLRLDEHVRWAGSVSDIPGFLSAGDLLLSASAHEGLSLAHLEALAMNVPVICTATAGTWEVARIHPGLKVVPLDASPEQFADAIEQGLEKPILNRRQQLLRHFSSAQMAERYHGLYHRLVAKAGQRAEGIWLITNNFSMGGAQSSARRLLLGLAGQGVKVRAAVVQENPEQPSAGRMALHAAGISVRSFGPYACEKAAHLVSTLLNEMDADPPEAVLFWNLLAPCKILLADGLLKTRVYDVSPGEMFFTSLAGYFANPLPAVPYLDPADYGRRLTGVIVKYQAEAARAGALGVPVHVIPNGVPIPHARPRPNNPVLRLGTAARIHPQKRLEDLLAALHLARNALPPFTMQVAGRVEPGSEHYFQELRRQAGGLPIEWLGELPVTTEFLASLDLCLMISEPAGCPNALLEALAAGLPVIATDVGGASEQVLDGVTGRLVQARDPRALAEALIDLVRHADIRRTLGESARRYIGERFTLEAMLRAYRRVCLGTADLLH